MFRNLDAFRTVPKDLAEASATGACMTVVAVLTCIVLFICETQAFLTAKPTTRIQVDSNQDALLRINFDVQLFDMSCDHVTVGVWDAFGTDKMNITKNVQKQRIDHKGSHKGRPYTEDEVTELEFSDKSFSKDELAELDSDWGSTSDKFKHDDFQAVVDAHDFTFVNFYADWCPHCLHFAPTWKVFEDKINEGHEKIMDADGIAANVRVLRLNCVDFESTCQQQRVAGFPTLRLYRRGQSDKKGYAEYQGARGPGDKGLVTFLKDQVAKRHMHSGSSYHDIFDSGCRLSGHVEVVRVPGTLHFQAVHSNDHTLNLAFTNVSHQVHHFSFGEAARQTMNKLPAEYKRHVNPLDGREFVAEKFHMEPHHFIKVVHTRFENSGIRSYQQTHQWSVRMLPSRKETPQAKFSYDLAPVEVVVSKGQRRWYDFVTSCFAIVGGAYTVMSMSAGMLKAATSTVKKLL